MMLILISILILIFTPGTWSDDAREWEFIPEEEKKSMGLNFDNDGEWWMSFQDFTKHFDQVEQL